MVAIHLVFDVSSHAPELLILPISSPCFTPIRTRLGTWDPMRYEALLCSSMSITTGT